jgi:hypothetical protein
MPLADAITNEDELEEQLSRPSPPVVEALSRLGGDLVVVGASGKMGPSLARMARRAFDEAGVGHDVIGIGRFANPRTRAMLEKAGVRCHSADLLDRGAVESLPNAAAVMYMVGVKFGTSGAEPLTWATNCYVAGHVAQRYTSAPTVVFSTGNVYPFVAVSSGGADEETPPEPIGEYGQSALGRERIYEFFAHSNATPIVLFRLNYAVELRYGILLDVARKVWEREPVDLGMGYVNVIWQSDAVAVALRCVSLAGTPATILNVTGTETIPVRALAERFGEELGRRPIFRGQEGPTALLSNATRAARIYGPYDVSLDRAIAWVAAWVKNGGRTLAKPTRFERRDGVF